MEIVFLIVSLVNLFFLIAIGLFLVRFRDRTNNIFADLIEAMEVMWGAVPVPPSESNFGRAKTWDEKYEEELDAMSHRLRENSNLKDLPSPSVSWGTPPAPQKIEGLTIKDR